MINRDNRYNFPLMWIPYVAFTKLILRFLCQYTINIVSPYVSLVFLTGDLQKALSKEKK